MIKRKCIESEANAAENPISYFLYQTRFVLLLLPLLWIHSNQRLRYVFSTMCHLLHFFTLFPHINHFNMDVRSSKQCFPAFVAAMTGRRENKTSWKKAVDSISLLFSRILSNTFSALQHLYPRGNVCIQCKVNIELHQFSTHSIYGTYTFSANANVSTEHRHNKI